MTSRDSDEDNKEVVSLQPQEEMTVSRTFEQTTADKYEPVGIRDLQRTDSLRVHQYLDVLEVLLCFERSNRYQVVNADGNQIFYIYEVGDCFARKLLGASRGLVMKMSDNDSQDVVSIHRPQRCSTRCCWMCCHLQVMEVRSPPDTPIAVIRELWRCGSPVYHVYNLNDELLYSVEGECCHCRIFTDIHFNVYEGSRRKKVATLTKHWGGCKEVIGASNDFSVKYLSKMDVKEKLTIFGSLFLVDFNYFERHCRC